jgi:multidrug transporter EmrE-like cation transporter
MKGKQIRRLIILIPALIALIITLITTLGGVSGQENQVWQTAKPYVFLFIFLVLFEYAAYRAHLHNIYINGFGVVAIAILDWHFFGLPLEVLILFIIPIAALMILQINPFQYNEREQDEGKGGKGDI